MRTATTIMIVISSLAGCYDGREDPASPFVSGGGTETGDGSSSGDVDAGDESGGASSSGGFADETTGGDEPDDGDRLTPCELCGCHRWSAVAEAVVMPHDVSLTALPDGGVLVVSAADEALTLERFASDGASVWSERFVGRVVNARAVVIGGEILAVVGTLGGSLALSANPSGLLQSAGGTDGFVALLSDSGAGALMWGERFGDAEDQRVGDVAVTGCDEQLGGCRLQLAGVHAGQLGLGPASAGDGATHLFHVQMDALFWEPETAKTWRIATTPDSDEELPSLVSAADGTTTFVGTVRDADPGDVVVRRIGADEQVVWDLRLAAPGEQQATAAALAGESLWLAGYVHTSTDLGAGAFGAVDEQAAFLAVLGADGEVEGSRTIAGWLPTRQALATTRAGTVVITGHASTDIDLGGGNLALRGATDVMVARYGSTGEFQCGALYGDVSVQEGMAVASAGDSTFVLARVEGSIDFGAAWQMMPGQAPGQGLVLAAFAD